MTDHITIPPEAVEAAAIDLHRSIWGRDCYSWAEIDGETRDCFRQHARAACLAMLNAWPKTLWDYKREDGTRLILPLTEASDEP